MTAWRGRTGPQLRRQAPLWGAMERERNVRVTCPDGGRDGPPTFSARNRKRVLSVSKTSSASLARVVSVWALLGRATRRKRSPWRDRTRSPGNQATPPPPPPRCALR